MSAGYFQTKYNHNTERTHIETHRSWWHEYHAVRYKTVFFLSFFFSIRLLHCLKESKCRLPSRLNVVRLMLYRWYWRNSNETGPHIRHTQKKAVDRKFKQLLNMQHHEYLCFPVENMKMSKCCTTEICYTQKWEKKRPTHKTLQYLDCSSCILSRTTTHCMVYTPNKQNIKN